MKSRILGDIVLGILFGLVLFFAFNPKIIKAVTGKSMGTHGTTTVSITDKTKSVEMTPIPVTVKQTNAVGDLRISVPKTSTVVLKKDMKKGDEVVVELQQDNSVVMVQHRRWKVGLYSYPEFVRPGIAYEICDLQEVFNLIHPGYVDWSRDVGINLGVTTKGLVLTASKALLPNVDVFLGTSGTTTFGLQIRF
jgi:hypothetical protein